METNALWALAASAALFVLFVSLELHKPLWQLILKPILGNFYRFLLFLIVGTLASYGVYQMLFASPSAASQPNAPATSLRPGEDSGRKKSNSNNDRGVKPHSSHPSSQQKSENATHR